LEAERKLVAPITATFLLKKKRTEKETLNDLIQFIMKILWAT
jgi:hypothetical protein